MQSILEQLAESLEHLLVILQDEAKRLQERHIDGLDQLLTNKLNALETIEALDNRRRQLLTQAGFSIDSAGMRGYLKKHDATTLASRWQEILTSLQQMQILNEANGRIIHRGLEQTGQMLAILQGEENQSVNLYGPSGQTTRSGGGSLTRA